MNLKQHQGAALLLAAIGGVLVSMYAWERRCQLMRGGVGRHVAAGAVRPQMLDGAAGHITPDALQHFGPKVLPAHWVKHRMSYPLTPGYNLERLMFGAPGSCAIAVPNNQRPWLFAPPSEMDY